MKSVGLDSCVVLRLLIGEPENQAALAKAFLDQCHAGRVRVCVSDMVVAEVYHALIYHYRVPKPEAVKALQEFLTSPMIVTTGHAIAVLNEYSGTGAGVVDRLIRQDYLDQVSEVVTFNSDFGRLENVKRLL